MGRNFRLGLHPKYAAECSKGGAVSLVVSLPRQGLVIHASSGLSVVSPTACPSTSRTTDCNSSGLLNAIVSYPLSAFTCSTLLTSQHLGARLLKITLPSPWVIASINPLTLCYMMIQDGHEPRVVVTLNVNIQCDWFATILKKKFSPDLLDDGREEQNESTDWLQAINRGGLLCVNNNTFEFLLTMERELRCHLSSNPETEFTGSEIKMNLKQSEDMFLSYGQ